MWKQIGIIGFAGIAYVAQIILRRHWMFHELDRNNYSHSAKFIEHEIPTEYYEPGKLGDHVKEVSFFFPTVPFMTKFFL